jgi:hypothetical protein
LDVAFLMGSFPVLYLAASKIVILYVTSII